MGRGPVGSDGFDQARLSCTGAPFRRARGSPFVRPPQESVEMNNVKVFVLMAGLSALVVAVGGLIGGSTGAMIALALSAAMNFAAYYGSSSMVLRAYGARVVGPSE